MLPLLSHWASKETLISLCPIMSNFNALDFSECRSEEVISFFWRSVYIFDIKCKGRTDMYAKRTSDGKMIMKGCRDLSPCFQNNQGGVPFPVHPRQLSGVMSRESQQERSTTGTHAKHGGFYPQVGGGGGGHIGNTGMCRSGNPFFRRMAASFPFSWYWNCPIC